MVDTEDKEFNKVYNKLCNIIDVKIKLIIKYRELGMGVNYKLIKILNLYIRYLSSVNTSNYKYFTVESLNNISNFLNKI